MPDVLVEVRGLRKVFGRGGQRVEALRGISFDIHGGEYLSIMGPSGSGKSTLFNLIGALDVPTEGHVRVGNIDLRQLGSRQLAYFRGRYIGYVFQTYNLIAGFSAEQNVAVPLIFGGAAHAAALERARAMLERVGLGHRLRHRPDELSGGQQQRVAIARALVAEPLLVLADEPTGNLDFTTGEEVIRLLCALCRERGVTVVSATHDHKMLAASDRILWIRDGTMEKIQTADEAQVRVGRVVARTREAVDTKGTVPIASAMPRPTFPSAPPTTRDGDTRARNGGGAR